MKRRGRCGLAEDEAELPRCRAVEGAGASATGELARAAGLCADRESEVARRLGSRLAPWMSRLT